MVMYTDFSFLPPTMNVILASFKEIAADRKTDENSVI